MTRKAVWPFVASFAVVCLLSLLTFAASDDKAVPNPLDGQWSGSWGLQIDPDGTVHQPVHAELFIQGDKVQLSGFPEGQSFAGKIQIDTGAKRLQITPADKTGTQPIVFEYALAANNLTLTDHSDRQISLAPVLCNPLGDVRIHFAVAVEVNAAGEALLRDYQTQRAGRSDQARLSDIRRPLTLKRADIFVTKDAGLDRITLDDARRLIHGPTPVVIAYHADDNASTELSVRWQKSQSDAVGRALSGTLRPKTLLFVVSEGANGPVAP